MIGLLGLVGWLWGEALLLHVTSESRPIHPLTALALTAGGAAIFARGRNWRRLAIAAASLVVLSGLVTLARSMDPAGAHTSEPVPPATLDMPVAAWPPAPVAVALTILGLAILLLCARRKPIQRGGIVLGSVGLALSLLSVGGFATLLGAPLRGVHTDVLFPLHTSVALLFAFGGVLTVGPQSTWLQTVFAREWRGRTSRVLLVSALVPVALAWLAEQGSRAGLYSPDARILVIVLGSGCTLTVLALLAASLLADERRDRDELARALDLSPNLLRDSEGRIIYWSQGCEDLYGWPAQEAIGRNCDELLGGCVPGLQAICGAGEGGESFWQGEAEHHTRDGNKIHVLLRVVLHDRGGERSPVALLSVTDLTEQRRAHEAILERDARLLQVQGELLEVSRLNSMGEMAAALAHELNQPLTAAANFLGAAEIGLRRIGGQFERSTHQRVEHALCRAREEMLRAGAIVRRLREFIAHGDVDMRRENLLEVVSDAVELGLTNVPAEAIEVDLQLDSEAEWVLADRVQTQQVLVNLVRNAAEAMLAEESREKALRVLARRISPGWVKVSVSDNGPGLPDAIGDSVFTPFTTSKATGMGVGLSISRRIIEAHGGTISLADTSGRGTNFEFTIPAFEQLEE